MKAEWSHIVTLSEEIDLDSFSCGENEIDIWLHRDALEMQDTGRCVVHVAIADDGSIVGFFTLSTHYLQRKSLPDDSRNSLVGGNIPAVLLGRLGVEKRYQHREGATCSPQGPLLVREAMLKARTISEVAGCRLLYVQALSADLIPWYQGLGFKSMPSKPTNLFLDIQRVDV